MFQTANAPINLNEAPKKLTDGCNLLAATRKRLGTSSLDQGCLICGFWVVMTCRWFCVASCKMFPNPIKQVCQHSCSKSHSRHRYLCLCPVQAAAYRGADHPPEKSYRMSEGTARQGGRRTVTPPLTRVLVLAITTQIYQHVWGGGVPAMLSFLT